MAATVEQKKQTILIVDDAPDNLALMGSLLKEFYKTKVALNGEKALQIALSQEPPDLILLDIMMPGIDGYEVCRRLKENKATNDIPVIFLTAKAEVEDEQRGLELGAADYITKPISPPIIAARVKTHLRMKAAADFLRDKNAFLEQEVARRTRDLEQANELKLAFIDVASHELRTPLAILLGLMGMALRRKDLPAPLSERLEGIDRAARRLQYLVDQLIRMLVAERFDQTLSRTPTAMAGLLRQAADDVRPFIEFRGQSLDVDVPDNLGTANVDALKIRDAVNQLLLNAIKFTPDGGRITLQAQRGVNGSLVIQVRDTGVGIDAEALPRMFEPFFTGFDVSHHASGSFEFGRQGLGLGLSVVKGFVELHGGSVAVQSERGHGSTFSLTLPGDGADGASN